MGKMQRDKGAREERAIVNYWQHFGYAAERVPLSGAAGGSFKGDVTIPFLNKDNVFEAKLRGNGFRQIYDWLDDNYGLFIRADCKPRLVVIPEDKFRELVQAAEGKKNEY